MRAIPTARGRGGDGRLRATRFSGASFCRCAGRRCDGDHLGDPELEQFILPLLVLTDPRRLGRSRSAQRQVPAEHSADTGGDPASRRSRWYSGALLPAERRDCRRPRRLRSRARGPSGPPDSMEFSNPILPRDAPRSEHLPGGARLLPRLLELRVLPGRTDLPHPRPRQLEAARSRIHAPEPARPDRSAELGRHLRTDAPPPRGALDLVTTQVERGHLVVTARSPRGPWSHIDRLDGDGIDPSLAFLDGRIHLTRTGRGDGPRSPVHLPVGFRTGLRRIRADEGAARDLEGHGWCLAGSAASLPPRRLVLPRDRGRGTSYGHSVVVARGRRPYGPFAPSPHGPLLHIATGPGIRSRRPGTRISSSSRSGSTGRCYSACGRLAAVISISVARRSWLPSNGATMAGLACPSWSSGWTDRRFHVGTGVDASEHVDFSSPKLRRA